MAWAYKHRAYTAAHITPLAETLLQDNTHRGGLPCDFGRRTAGSVRVQSCTWGPCSVGSLISPPSLQGAVFINIGLGQSTNRSKDNNDYYWSSVHDVDVGRSSLCPVFVVFCWWRGKRWTWFRALFSLGPRRLRGESLSGSGDSNSQKF